MITSSESNSTVVPESQFIDKESKLSKEEECDYYRQRFSSIKIVLEESQNELILYKERCRGVSTIQLLLKESRQENVKLSKHVQALEAAISILQKRLDKNGLSISWNIQEAELFVPGASKQTFDNLAKETARLRSLLKQENNGLLGKKLTDEIEGMKGALEEAESENNELKNKIKNMGAIKLKLVSDYEGVIEKLTKESQEEKNRFEKELKARELKQFQVEERRKSEKTSPDAGAVQDLKDLLVKTVEKCNQLNGQLPVVSDYYVAGEKSRRLSLSQEEDYNRLALKHQEAVKMNQRWQLYNKEQEKQIQEKNERIQELNDQMPAMIDQASNQKTAEFQKQIKGLLKELENVRKGQDDSTVEILKQQIQVCTEDFNTERKDREQAVQNARILEQDLSKLTAENVGLKRQIEHLKTTEQSRQLKKLPTYESSLNSSSHSNESSPPPQYSQLGQGSNVRYSFHQSPIQESPAQSIDQTIAMPFVDNSSSSSAGVQNTEHLSPVSHPNVINYYSIPRPSVPGMSGSLTPPMISSMHSDMRSYAGASRLPPTIVPGSSTPPIGTIFNYASMPRPNIPGSSTSPLGNISMPSLTRRGAQNEEEITCPKCNVKFSNDILMSHINKCTQ